MNSSQFMDKQIMDLSASKGSTDFMDLINSHDDHDDVVNSGLKKDEILPNYDFQPIRPPVASQNSNHDGARVWNSADSKSNNSAGIRNFGSDPVESSKVIREKDRNLSETAIVSEIDRTMKKYADDLLHAMEGVSARLSQLESRTRNIENSVDDLKISVGNNHGSTDGKMRQLENILREVQTGVQVLRDKQEIVEAQLQLAKVQVSKPDQHPETTQHSDSSQQPIPSAPQQSYQQLPPATLPPPEKFPYPPQNAPQRDPYFPPPPPPQEASNQQYQLPPTQPPQLPPAAPPHQQYQPPPPTLPHPQFSQPPPPPPQQPLQHPPLPPINPPLVHQPEEPPYIPTQTYTQNLRQPPSQPPPSGPPPSQQFYGGPNPMYEPPSNRPGSSFSTGYGPPSLPNEPYTYSGPPSQYGGGGGNTMKPPQLSPPSIGSSGGSGYPQLPTARMLPHAVPMASGVRGGSGGSSSGDGNRVPIDDVVDKVTNMGFPRDHVRATVRRLTENGQSVDLNVVLDKLMNDGDVQPPKGWFGR